MLVNVAIFIWQLKKNDMKKTRLHRVVKENSNSFKNEETSNSLRSRTEPPRWFIRVNSNSIGAARAVGGGGKGESGWGGGWIFLCNLPERFKNPGDPAIYLALCYAEPRQRKIDGVTASNPSPLFVSFSLSPLLPLLVSSPLGSPKPRTDPCDHPFPQPMRDDRGGHLGWRVIERKRWVRNLLWGCVLSAPLGVRWEREKERGREGERDG